MKIIFTGILFIALFVSRGYTSAYFVSPEATGTGNGSFEDP